MNEQIDQIFEFLAQGSQPNDYYFSEAYNIVYDFITLNPIDQSLTYIFDHISFLFQNLISHTLEDDSISQYSQIVFISQKFKEFKILIRKLFKIIERYSMVCINNEIDKIFLSIFHSSVDFNLLSSIFFEVYNSFHFNCYFDSPEFSNLLFVSKLIHFAYSDKQNELLQILIKNTQESSEQFLTQINIKEMQEFITCLIQYLDIEQTLLFTLFKKEFATTAFISSYKIITSLSIPQIDMIRIEIQKSCQNRELTFILNYYDLITFYEPSNEHLTFLSGSICEQISNESTSLADLQQLIPFYDDLYYHLDNIVLTKSYDRSIVELLNKNHTNLMKELFSAISKCAKSNPGDISNLLPILSRLENKSEFELVYAYHITKRIVPPTEKQIEKEKTILQQIKSRSSSYHFSNLFKLLQEASSSIEKHLGPVLICHSTLWPFHPPFPKCEVFNSICQEISEKYRNMFPNRILTFPFNSWVVSIKNTEKNYFISGNAVQAQVLMHFNEHYSINVDSLSPLILDYQLKPVLNSLSSEKMPILIKNEKNCNEYILNNDFKPKHPFINLPSSAFAKRSAPKDLAKAKSEQMNASIMHLMKEKRIMKYSELESLIIEKMSDRFYVTQDEFRTRINDLMARDFIRNGEDPSFLIYVP